MQLRGKPNFEIYGVLIIVIACKLICNLRGERARRAWHTRSKLSAVCITAVVYLKHSKYSSRLAKLSLNTSFRSSAYKHQEHSLAAPPCMLAARG